MSYWKSSLCPLVFTLTLGWAASGAAQNASLGITYFEIPGGNFASGSQANDINDDGTIVGSYYDGFSARVFIRQSNGVFTTFDPPGGMESEALATVHINAAGTILLSYYNLEAVRSNFLRDSRGQYTAIDVPGSKYTYASVLNSSGAIAGTYYNAQLKAYNFVRSASGVFTTFQVPGEVGSAVVGMNDSGAVVGDFTYSAQGYNHGYIRNADGEITVFDVPGTSSTTPNAIDAKGEVAGVNNKGWFIRDNGGAFRLFPYMSIDCLNQEGDGVGGGDGYLVVRYSDGEIAQVEGSFFADLTPGAINSSRTVSGYTDNGRFFFTQPLSTIDYSTGFAAASESVNLKGSAAVNGSQLMLTNGADSEASSAFYGYPVDIRSFTTDFTFLPSDAVADGLTFTIQNDDPSAVGFPGAGLGYQRIDKSVAVKFDFHNNFGEGSDSTGLYLNGVSPTIPAIDLSHTGIKLASGDPMKVHVIYDSASVSENLTLTITDDFTMDTWSKTFTVDIPGTVGATTAYVGFTASTGEKTSTLAISSWTYQAATATP